MKTVRQAEETFSSASGPDSRLAQLGESPSSNSQSRCSYLLPEIPIGVACGGG